jgi:hypothetical protein
VEARFFASPFLSQRNNTSGSIGHSGSAPEEDDGCGPGGANGVGVMACGQTVAARRDDFRDGRLQRRHRTAEQRKRLAAQRELADGPYLAQGAMASRGEGHNYIVRF